MIITLTGTPGTGKTTVAEELEEFKVLDLKKYAKENGLGTEGEKEYEVDIDALKSEFKGDFKDFTGKMVVEGHFSHHLDSDLCIVLRTRPDELRERLKDRGYSENKVEENIEAEKLDLILAEAVNTQDKVYEIDTTEKSVQDILEEVVEAIRNEKEEYGVVDWSEYI